VSFPALPLAVSGGMVRANEIMNFTLGRIDGTTFAGEERA
jgi:hypothetical protein